MPSLAAGGAVAVMALGAGYLGAAYVSGNAPFAPEHYFSRATVVGALPADFPVPDGARMSDTGPGAAWPYRIEWVTDGRTSEVAGAMTRRLDSGAWSVTRSTSDGEAITLRAARDAAGVEGDAVADVRIVAEGNGVRILLEFSPLPPTRVSQYGRWLEDQGIVVKNVAPEDYGELRR
jgi:hypothetical protein